jgi:hypothetical protein
MSHMVNLASFLNISCWSSLACPPRSGSTWDKVRETRKAAGVVPSYKRIDTCAAEFEAATPYMYSCYDGNDESEPTTARKVSA